MGNSQIDALIAVGTAIYRFLVWICTGPTEEVEAFIWRIIWVSLYIGLWIIVFRYLWYWAFHKKIGKK